MDVEENKLPPGWDEKYDPNTGLYFYINYITKTTTFDDPRIKHRQSVSTGTGGTNYGNSTESIPMQPLHGSPYHVYPANNYPAVQPAFQGPMSGVISHSASPLLAAKLQQMEMSPVTRPPTPRTNAHFSRNNIQETSFTNTAAETEASVAKINTMFPTVSDTHIRLLLKKYYNREAVVISALQVEKHPITTPGPYSTPPPTNRHFHNTALGCTAIFQMTPPLNRDFSRTGSPIWRPGSCASGSYGSPRFGENFRSSPKPHSSPKMKLRYLKSIFPKAEETLLLDVLANADNHVQKASEELTAMGYEKKDTTIPKVSMRKKDEAKNEIKNRIDRATPPQPPPKVKTTDEKNKCGYLKSIFPKAEETLLLDVLANADNHVQKASEELTAMGYEKKDTTIPKVSMRKKDEAKNEIMNRIDRATPPQPPPKVKTTDEKNKLKLRLQSQYKDIPEKIISMALESVDYSEDKALAILNIVTQEDDKAALGVESAPKKVEKNANETPAAGHSAPSRSSSTSSAKRQGEISNKISVAQEQECESVVDAPTAPSSSSTASPSTKEVSSDDVLTAEDTGIALDGVRKRQARAKAKNDHTKAADTHEDPEAVAKKSDFKSVTPRTSTAGPNSALSKGPNDELLLVDYVTWNGANPDLAVGRKQLAKGSDPKNRSERSYVPKGANSELCKGPRQSLAKGSIYNQLTKGIPAGASVICN
uniref:WW domain-containing protein n=2 Tax=Lutzomyia longipalpis TaxID=7200 RepID=A0A1B0CMK1_LUTLO